MKRVAAIDCGTNSIRLLIADVEAGALVDVVRLMEVVRLGQGVDRTGQFHPEALARTLEATGRYAQLCAEHQVEAIRFVATSASRDASNRDEFFSGVHELLGVTPEVITGTEEAQLSFTGATSVLPDDGGHRLVVDIGGGSTELVLGTGRSLESSISLDIGCVRMTERHLASDPASEAEITAARADIRSALDRAESQVPLDSVRTLVGVAGSVTTVTAHALGLDRYDPTRINGAAIPAGQVQQACAELLAMPRAQRSELGFMHPGRVDVIGAGALVWSEVVERVAQRAGEGLGPVVTSEHDILDGIALAI